MIFPNGGIQDEKTNADKTKTRDECRMFFDGGALWDYLECEGQMPEGSEGRINAQTGDEGKTPGEEQTGDEGKSSSSSDSSDDDEPKKVDAKVEGPPKKKAKVEARDDEI